MAVHFVDTIQILPFVFRLVLYGSGVIFSVDAYVDRDDWVHYLFVANPMYCYISFARWSAVGSDVSGQLIVSGALWAVLLLVGGFFWFRSAEETYARD